MKKKKINIIKTIEIIFVNLITLTRLFGALVLPFLYYFMTSYDFAIITICLFLTDTIDGFLARKLNISTFFGSAIDAISDKLLNIVSFILLGFSYNFMLIPLIIEILIIYTSFSTYKYGGNVKSTNIGKIKTVILDIFVIISFLLLSLPKFNIDNNLINYLIRNTPNFIDIFSVIITVSCSIALYDYIRIYNETKENPKSIVLKDKKRKRKKIVKILKDSFNTEYYQKHKNESILDQLYK